MKAEGPRLLDDDSLSGEMKLARRERMFERLFGLLLLRLAVRGEGLRRAVLGRYLTGWLTG